MTEIDKDDYSDKFSDFYIFIKYLGSGSFGKVVHAIDRQSSQEVAVKVIEKNTVKPEKISDLKKEAEILSSLHHPNIVKFIHLKETQTRIFLVMELLKVDLQTFLSTHKLSDLEASQIMTGVLRAVEYMHSKNVIHRDIKPENILISSSKDLTSVKVTDFGLSSQFDRLQENYSEIQNCGTLKYMAPEQTGHRFYSQPVDIWSCGITMYTLLTSRHPLVVPSETKETYLKKLQSPKWKFPGDFSQTAKSLFLKMVEMIPIDRYTARQALHHPWISRQEVKPPLTSFEKFKVYGEHLKLKGIVFPVFFLCLVAEKEIEEAGSKKDEGKKPPLHSPVKKKEPRLFHRGMTTPSPEVSFVKRNFRISSPAGSASISRKLTPKEFIKRKAYIMKKAKSFEKT
jgi:serine/threonine protein kinase